ncbi:hypothetical protein BGZ94_002979, partial [Podila epigama]
MKAVAVHRPLDASTVSYWALIFSVLFPSMQVLAVQVTTSSSSSPHLSNNNDNSNSNNNNNNNNNNRRVSSSITTTYSLKVFLESPVFEPLSLSFLSSLSSPPSTVQQQPLSAAFAKERVSSTTSVKSKKPSLTNQSSTPAHPKGQANLCRNNNSNNRNKSKKDRNSNCNMDHDNDFILIKPSRSASMAKERTRNINDHVQDNDNALNPNAVNHRSSSRSAKAARRVFVKAGNKAQSRPLLGTHGQKVSTTHHEVKSSDDKNGQDMIRGRRRSALGLRPISSEPLSTKTVRVLHLEDDDVSAELESFLDKSSSKSTMNTDSQQVEQELVEALWTYWKDVRLRTKNPLSSSSSSSSSSPLSPMSPEQEKKQGSLQLDCSSSPSTTERCFNKSNIQSMLWHGQVNDTNWNMSSTGILSALPKDKTIT